MGSIASVMDIARQALTANQEALNVTANNVANQNTAGYTRQVVNFESFDAVTLNGDTYGAGVTATERSQRDRVLEQRVQQQTQVQSQAGALQSALQQVENIFGLQSSSASAASTALGSSINSFFSSLTALTGNPSSPAIRQNVLSTATGLAATFNSASNQLSDIASSLNQQVVSDAGQINSLTTTIASLNQQITGSSPTSDAGTLEDQRQQAITQLSQLVGLDQIATEGNGITLTTTNGALLVSGNQSFALNATQVGGATQVIGGVGGQNITASLSGGDLGGVLQARDQQLPSYTNALDKLAYGIGSQVNAVNQAGVDGNGNPGAALFSFATGASGAAASIQVSATSSAAVAAAGVGQGSAGNTNALALANIQDSVVVGSQTAASFVASFLSQVGSDASSAATNNGAQQATLAQLSSQRNSLSGVSLDQEAANLTQYQRSYQAASQLFTIANSIMASAINLGVETAVN
ncbi:MAG: flagellar hook-associated protein FlgK [Acidobacteriota bacterium]|nr:flagellar hook-associated protein FlgK [Acidobacteriota bacterium]